MPLPAALGALAGVAHAATGIGVDDAYTVPASTFTSSLGNVTANDAGTAPRTVTDPAVHALSNGSANVVASGNLFFQPSACGSASFNYAVQDAASQTGNALVTITVVSPMVADAYTTNANTSVNGNLRSNDLPAGNSPGVTGTSTPLHGSLTIDTSNAATNGSFNYVPATNFSGLDQFTYSDNAPTLPGCTSNTMVSITVLPVANADAYSSTSAGVGGNVLTNDIGTSLTLVSATGPAHGTANISSSGNFYYTPFAGFSGVDNFTYTVEDSSGLEATAAATFTVSAAPVGGVLPAPAASKGVLALLAGLLAFFGLRRRRAD